MKLLIIYEIKEPWAEQNILEIAFGENIIFKKHTTYETG